MAPEFAAIGLPGELQKLLSESAEVLLSADEPDAMLQGLFTKIAGPLGVDTYFNYIVNEAGDALRLESCYRIPDEEARRTDRLEFGQAVCGAVALSRGPVVATWIQQSLDPMVPGREPSSRFASLRQAARSHNRILRPVLRVPNSRNRGRTRRL